MILLFANQKEFIDLKLFNNEKYGLMDYVDFTNQNINIKLYDKIIKTCLERVGEKPIKIYFKITKIFKVFPDLHAIANFYVYVKYTN